MWGSRGRGALQALTAESRVLHPPRDAGFGLLFGVSVNEAQAEPATAVRSHPGARLRVAWGGRVALHLEPATAQRRTQGPLRPQQLPRSVGQRTRSRGGLTCGVGPRIAPGRQPAPQGHPGRRQSARRAPRGLLPGQKSCPRCWLPLPRPVHRSRVCVCNELLLVGGKSLSPLSPRSGTPPALNGLALVIPESLKAQSPHKGAGRGLMRGPRGGSPAAALILPLRLNFS